MRYGYGTWGNVAPVYLVFDIAFGAVIIIYAFKKFGIEILPMLKSEPVAVDARIYICRD